MKKRSKKGFTLIELIVVIAILAILAIIAIPVVTGLVDRANTSAAEANGRTLELAVKAYITSQGGITTIDGTHVDAAMNAFGLTDSALINGGKYNYVVTTSGTGIGDVTATVSSGTTGKITP